MRLCCVIRGPSNTRDGAGAAGLELLCLRLSTSRWQPLHQNIEDTDLKTWLEVRRYIEEKVGFMGKTHLARMVSKQLNSVEGLSTDTDGSSRLGVVHIFQLFQDDELLLTKVGKASWSLNLSANSVPLSTLLYVYAKSVPGFDSTRHRWHLRAVARRQCVS